MTARLEQLSIAQMTQEDAEEIVGWRYEPPYDFYDGDSDEEDLAALLSAERREGYAFSAKDADGHVVGFFSFGRDARVVVVGLGLRPELTGLGLGTEFVERGLEFARGRFAPTLFRLSVAAFNERAIVVYERAGFVRTREFAHRTNGGVHPFVEMERPA